MQRVEQWSTEVEERWGVRRAGCWILKHSETKGKAYGVLITQMDNDNTLWILLRQKHLPKKKVSAWVDKQI